LSNKDTKFPIEISKYLQNSIIFIKKNMEQATAQVQAKLKLINIVTLVFVGSSFLLKYLKSDILESNSLEIRLGILAVVIGLFIYRIFLEVKHKLFDLKKYYILIFFIAISFLFFLYSWFLV
jgi:hypothetical protein